MDKLETMGAAMRQAHNLSLLEAGRIGARRALRADIKAATTLEELKRVLLAIYPQDPRDPEPDV